MGDTFCLDDGDLSLSDGLWDYLMMDDSDDTSSSIIEDILLTSPLSLSPPPPSPTIESTTTNANVSAKMVASQETDEDVGGEGETNYSMPSEKDEEERQQTKANTKTTTEVLEEKLLALEKGPPPAPKPDPPVLSSSSSCFYDHGEEKKETHNFPELAVEDIEHANHDDIDAILQKQMDQLSMNEKMKYKKEIHGLTDDGDDNHQSMKETPEFVADILQQMEDCLQQKSSTTTTTTNTSGFVDDGTLLSLNRDAYERASYTSPEYVCNPKFRLPFLRGSYYNPHAAAITFIRHFQTKFELFGKDVLTRDIKLSDLTTEDIQALKQGSEQLLPTRDIHDRLIVCMLATGHKPLYGSRCRNRAMFYFAMSVMRELNENSNNGLIMVVMNVGKNRVFFDEVSNMIKCRQQFHSYPNRGSAFHYCYDDVRIYPLVAFVQFLLLSKVKGRFLSQYGDFSKHMYHLQTYGIPTHAIPLDKEGNVLIDNHLQWIEQLRICEEKSLYTIGSTPSYILVPRRFDVLLGRGTTASQHTGNLRAFHIVEMNRARYENASKFEKTQIAERIVHLINQSYGRFLKRDITPDDADGTTGGSVVVGSGGWVETTMDEARAKISHCFRRLRELDSKKSKAKLKSSSSPMSTTTSRSKLKRKQSGE